MEDQNRIIIPFIFFVLIGGEIRFTTYFFKISFYFKIFLRKYLYNENMKGGNNFLPKRKKD